MSDTKKKRETDVYTLVVEVGRKAGDGLPEKSTGAALMCFASGVDEAEAVRETVAVLKQAEMAPLDVTGHGTFDERIEAGHEIGEDERELMARAKAENAVIVVQVTPFYGEPVGDGKTGAKGAGPGTDGKGATGKVGAGYKQAKSGSGARGAKTKVRARGEGGKVSQTNKKGKGA